MKELKFPLLTADEIEVRVGQVMSSGYTLLLYKDARVDMKLLDQVVGAYNWKREHKELKGNIYCGVSIYDDERKQWVEKWDCGKESNTEAEKGEASDSFKRACVNIGIGRELYETGFLFVKGGVVKNDKGNYVLENKYRKHFVKSIVWNENPLSLKELIIVDENGVVLLEKGTKTKSTTQPKKDNGVIDPRTINVADTFLNNEKGSATNEQKEFINNKVANMDSVKSKLFFDKLDLRYNTRSIDMLSEQQASELIDGWKGKAR